MSRWLVETGDPGTGFQVSWAVTRELFRQRSPHQEVTVVELTGLGRALFLDGVLQLTTADEFIYHEMLAHVPLLCHPAPRDVLVVGGGDGGTVREVLRHPEVRRVDLVELDGVVVQACRRHLPEVGADVWEDPRLRVHLGDGARFIQEAPDGAYDVVLVDCSDPGGPASPLYSGRFYHEAARVLGEDGILVQQAMSPFFHGSLIRSALEGLRAAFPRTGLYLCAIPSYLFGLQAFVWASRGLDLAPGPVRPAPPGLRWYTPDVHRAAFTLPPVIAELLERR